MSNEMVIDDTSVYTGLGEEQRQLISSGQVVVYPGRDPAKPVLRWAPENTKGGKPGALVTGSGVSPRHRDGDNGGGWKNSNAWLELLQRRMDADDGGGFEEVVNGMIKAALGYKETRKYECEACSHPNYIEISRAPDPRAGIKLIEFLVPKPEQRSTVDVNMQVLQGQLSELIHLESPDQVQAHGLTPAQIEARRKAVEDADA